jgi:hypothetical protein
MITQSLPTSEESKVEFNYSEVKDHLNRLLEDWRSVITTGGSTVVNNNFSAINTTDQFKGEGVLSYVRRELRRDNRDLPTMRIRGEASADDNYIPQRLIDRAITQEKPAQLGFLEQPDRLLIFKDLSAPEQPTEDIERAFTDHMRYPGWTIPWHRAFDGMDLHGGVALEVIVDTTKPLYAAVEYIRREDLIFPVEATDIQACEFIMRRYRHMPFELERFVKEYGFNETAVKQILGDSKSKRHQKIEIFKCYCKKEGLVYVFWYSEKSENNFLKDPEPYNLGIRDPGEIEQYTDSVNQYSTMQEAISTGMIPVMGQQQSVPPQPPPALPMENYPIFWLPFEVVEDDRLLASKGMAFRYKADQEAATELWTSAINAANRASKVYASYENDPLNQTGISPSDKLIPNTITARKVAFWNFPFPDSGLLAIIQAFSNNVAAGASQVDYAVSARPDRKTAEEVRSATSQAAQVKSVGVSGQSLTILAVYKLCWEVGRSFILMGEIPTFPIPKERLLHKFVVASAGDSDVLRRDQRRQIIRETFQYLAGTPIGNQFLIYLINTFFPEQAKLWNPILEAQDPLQLIQVAMQLLSSIPRGTLLPEQSSQLDQILGLFNDYISKRTAGQGGVSAGAPQLAEPSTNTVANNLPQEQGGSASGASNG